MKITKFLLLFLLLYFENLPSSILKEKFYITILLNFLIFENKEIGGNFCKEGTFSSSQSVFRTFSSECWSQTRGFIQPKERLRIYLKYKKISYLLYRPENSGYGQINMKYFYSISSFLLIKIHISLYINNKKYVTKKIIEIEGN